MNKAAPIWNGGQGDAAVSAARILPKSIGEDTTQSRLGYITEDDDSEVQALIDQQFVELCGKKFTGRPCGYMTVIKIYVRPEELKTIKDADGKEVTLYLPDMALSEDRFQSCVGLVIAVGPGAFKNPDGSSRYHGPRPFSVGDWVQFPRSDIVRVDYRGVALGVMKDDRGLMVIDDPADFTPGHLTTRL